MNIIQSMLQSVEVGKGQFLVRALPLIASIFFIGGAFNFLVYHGLNDAQSMDNAQLARQIVRGEGFTTKFLRPYAITQLQNYAASQAQGAKGELFPASQFPAGKPRILPDTYNAPGYPGLLAAWFYLLRPDFKQSPVQMAPHHMYAPDAWIPLLNQIFVLLTAILIFVLSLRLFDDRVAWLATVAFLASNTIWLYTLTALSTNVLMFLITALLFCSVEIFGVGEACFESTENSFASAWAWAIFLALFLAAACLTRLHLLVLLAPVLVFLGIMPRSHPAIGVLVATIVILLVAPWFWHLYSVSGNILGSNTPQLIYGEGDYRDNQIFCTTSIPSYESLFRAVGSKESMGFRWHLEHAWELLGSNPLIVLFGAAILHQFKRRRTQAFHWLVIGSAVSVVALNNLGVTTPDAVGPWNTIIIFFPCMVVIGSAFFFIMLDRLRLEIALLRNLIVIILLSLTALPLVLSIAFKSNQYYNYPPYAPPLIKLLGEFAKPDEWVTSDMPWATAWYADRGSLWLPDSISDFENFHDNVCPSGMLILTPITWAKPLNSLTDGEEKEWIPFFTNGRLPANFPLSVHTATPPPGPAYSFWSDTARWTNPNANQPPPAGSP